MINKIRLFIILFVVLGFMFSVATPILAHPGRTDGSGCHICRTNCTSWGLSYGEYHCHRTKALPQPLEPIKSHKVEGGTGYTTPASEYKIPKTDNSINTTSNVKPSLWSRFLSFFGIR